ncbi:NUDIX domain-containing protein [Frankia sp. AgB1.9]|uniref:NUDIX domain-containing protein n=1 Tax=unclassified Frankia TaxID=2632575 RepID=UPI0019339B94|nr:MULTISPECIES: NUDIX domain-containing protein [unclassified Frankia]MBL7492730.1 NUDIX domain-containing protein [Frankia sp. AgW1.1]MBL7551403.1 NUDIX domain-containing protein [Frankia sp. AgB1.9]MBL7620738.1 NUDIX domain-containing protein [Frankia sp. AgB1.8]
MPLPPPTRTEISARLLVLTDDRALLVRRRGQAWYFLPGGPVEPGETVEAALRRRADEEAGLDIAEVELVGCAEHSYVADGVLVHELSTVFAARLPWGAQIISNRADFHLTAVALDELADLDLRPPALTGMIHGWSRDHRSRWHTTLPAG